jgi:2,2-dialkylglycine decarboxylase (pyruvate)
LENDEIMEKAKRFVMSSPSSRARMHDVIITSGKGSYLFDKKGRKYLDLGSGLWCAILGHSNSEFNEALIDQIGKIIHTGGSFWSPSVLDAAEQIACVTSDNLNKVTLLCTGSEATELALRMAKVLTGKHEIVGMERGYYGITHGALSASGQGTIHGMTSPRMVGSHKILAPYCYRCPVHEEYPACGFLCLEVSTKLIDCNTTGNISAFIFEPILVSGGVIIPPEGYFKRLEQLAAGYGAILIDDEVTTGIGRTGEWFGIQSYGVAPDIMFASKTLGGGFPVAAVITTTEIDRGLLERHLTHSQSHLFDPLPAAAAAAVIKIARKLHLVEHSRREGDYFLKRLNELKEKHALIGDVRGRGLLLGIEIADPTKKTPNVKDGSRLEMELFKSGVITSFSTFSSVLRILPPLIIEREEIDFAVETIDDSLRKVSNE